MITKPDFLEKKILHIYAKDANKKYKLRIKNFNIILEVDGKLTNKVSVYLVFSIFIIGHISITTEFLKILNKYGINLYFLNFSYRLYSAINFGGEGNFVLRKKQHTLSEDIALNYSKLLIIEKLKNQYKLLKRYENIELDPFLILIKNANHSGEIRAIEGNFAKKYFSGIFSKFGWYRRAPRTKEDITNLLLDIGYTFLFNYIDALLNLFGFDNYKGFFHTEFFKRKSLVCDVMEPARPIIDRALLRAYNLSVINIKDFKYQNGAFKIRNGHSLKYVNLLFEVISKYNSEIYDYCIGFYRFFMNPDKYKFPKFKMKR